MLRWTLRSWFLCCIGIAVLVGGWQEIWRPHRSRFVTKPHWIGPESEEQMDQIMRIMTGPPPEISGEITLRELIQILNDIYPTRLDPDCDSADERIGNVSVGRAPITFESWLKMILESLWLRCKVHCGCLYISDYWQGLDRVYPFPVMDSYQLIRSLEMRSSDWSCNGGLATISVIDTDSQSLLIVRADYATHLELERELVWYYETAGIGWRTDRSGWQNLPRFLLNRLASLIADETPATKPTPGTAQGSIGCWGGFVSGS